MKSIVYYFLFCILLAACNKEDTQKDSYEYFKTELNAGMSYDAIVNKFGEPDSDEGSGIHIYVYRLKDGTKIWIGYTDKILYARHVDDTGNTLHVLVFQNLHHHEFNC